MIPMSVNALLADTFQHNEVDIIGARNDKLLMFGGSRS